METSQSYETTIIDTDSGLAAHFYVAPARSLHATESFKSENELLSYLQLTPIVSLRASDLPDALALWLIDAPPKIEAF